VLGAISIHNWALGMLRAMNEEPGFCDGLEHVSGVRNQKSDVSKLKSKR